MKRNFVLFAIILFLFSFIYGMEKDVKKKKKKEIRIKQEIVVTANLTKGTTFNTSAETEVKNFKEVREKIPYNVGDFFKDMPGVDVSQTGPNSVRPVIRGLYDERVLILLNGVRLSEQRSGGNHLLSLDPLQVKRIEVVEGPDSVVYGSNAIGGGDKFYSLYSKQLYRGKFFI